MTTRDRWVFLSYRLPRDPSAPRLAVWRRLKRLGVAQLLDGLVALPADSRNREQLEWTAEQVTESGGEAAIWLAEATTAGPEPRDRPEHERSDRRAIPRGRKGRPGRDRRARAGSGAPPWPACAASSVVSAVATTSRRPNARPPTLRSSRSRGPVEELAA